MRTLTQRNTTQVTLTIQEEREVPSLVLGQPEGFSTITVTISLNLGHTNRMIGPNSYNLSPKNSATNIKMGRATRKTYAV